MSRTAASVKRMRIREPIVITSAGPARAQSTPAGATSAAPPGLSLSLDILPGPCARSTSSSRSATADALSREEIAFFVDGVTDGSLPDYQASALLMAIVLRGHDRRGNRLADRRDGPLGRSASISSDIPGVKVDKHSTGGVGDKTSLVLAPLAAACGVPVPMMSGRGLGHTGGTLDKLESDSRLPRRPVARRDEGGARRRSAAP